MKENEDELDYAPEITETEWKDLSGINEIIEISETEWTVLKLAKEMNAQTVSINDRQFKFVIEHGKDRTRLRRTGTIRLQGESESPDMEAD